MEYFNDEPKFLDPSDWNIASYNAHPIDQIEPVAAEASSYRSAALHCLQILASVDRFMSRAGPEICGLLGLLFHPRSD